MSVPGIVAVGSTHREAVGIIRRSDYDRVEAPEDFISYGPQLDDPANGSAFDPTDEPTNNSPAIVLSGSGADRARRATMWAINHYSPRAVLSFGFCGATKDNQQSGDIVIAANVISLPGSPFDWSSVESAGSLGPDRTLGLAARTAVEVAGLDYHHGTLVTVSRVAKTAGVKRWLGESIDATAVDTAAHGVATAASEAGVPWVSITSILDPREFEVPKVVDRVGSGPRERGITAYLRHLSSYPLDLPVLLRLGRSSARASAALTTFMGAFLEAHSALEAADRALALAQTDP